MKVLPALLGALVAIAALEAPQARAHEMRSVYLEIRERRPNEFDVIWKAPALRGAAPLEPTLPEGCEVSGGASVDTDPGVDLRRWSLRCRERPLVGQRIGVAGLSTGLADAFVRVAFADGTAVLRALRPGASSFVVSPTTQTSIADSVRLGVHHILFGLDHLLFILLLLRIVPGTRRIVGTLTSFTLAHSITLALATIGIVHVPSAPVEAVIALSIVFLATELARSQVGLPGVTVRRPWIAAFSFGLLHGFGFAGGLTELGLPEADIPRTLFFFNVGVEVGQLAFVAAAAVVWTFLRRFTARPPARGFAYALGSIGAYWCVERVAAFL